MPLRRALLSAVTLFGGHFLNRRLDRVVLVGVLLLLIVGVAIGVPYVLFVRSPTGIDFIVWALRLPPILFGTLALISAGLTFFDARQRPGEPLSTTMRVAGVALSVIGMLLVAAALIASPMRVTPVPLTETQPDYGAVGPGRPLCVNYS